MSVEHVLKNTNIYYVSLLVLLANVFLNSLKLDISFIVPASTPRRNDLVVKRPEEFLRFLHFLQPFDVRFIYLSFFLLLFFFLLSKLILILN